jgi:hypothetical protein
VRAGGIAPDSALKVSATADPTRDYDERSLQRPAGTRFFRADRNLTGEFRPDNGKYTLQHDFQLNRGVSTMPKAPIP